MQSIVTLSPLSFHLLCLSSFTPYITPFSTSLSTRGLTLHGQVSLKHLKPKSFWSKETLQLLVSLLFAMKTISYSHLNNGCRSNENTHILLLVNILEFIFWSLYAMFHVKCTQTQQSEKTTLV